MLGHDFVAMCQTTGIHAARGAPPYQQTISTEGDFRQLNEDLCNALELSKFFLQRGVAGFSFAVSSLAGLLEMRAAFMRWRRRARTTA